MAMYRVQRGDTLLSIAKKTGIPWQTLQSWNRGAIPSASTPLRIGASLYTSRPGTYGSSVAQELTKDIPIQAPKAFSEFLPWETFFPKQQIEQFTASQVDPEYNRIRSNQVGQFDWKAAINNAFRSGFTGQNRQALNDQISRERNNAYANLFGQQKDLFSQAYGNEEQKYAADPTKYVPTDYISRFLK